MVADLASVRENCTIGKSVLIGRGVAVENNTSIGDHTKIQTNAYITAYMVLEDHVFIAPMVTTTNDNFMGRTEKRFALKKGATIKRGARVGGNSILLPGVTIGEESFVAAGAIVTKDTPPRQVVKGIPAKPVRPVPEEELLPE
jgi:acetyltransferase-like isoleucine patch superfamily enzyme